MTDSLISAEAKVRIGYAVAGVLTGALWLAHDGSPLEHAVRLLALMAVVTSGSWIVHRIAERNGRTLPHHPIGRFLVAKAAIVAVALSAAVAIEGWVVYPNLWVALGMGAVVMLVGPVLHPWLMNDVEIAAEDEAMERLVVAR